MYKNNANKFILGILLIGLVFVYVRFMSYENRISDIEAVGGYINLASQDLEEGIVTLNGQWKFYPYEFRWEGRKETDTIQVPGMWKDYTVNGKAMGQDGYGTYMLRVSLPKEGLYALDMGGVCSAYKLVINGKEIQKNGTIGTNYKEEIATFKKNIVPFYANSREIEIGILVSNYHYNKGGLMTSILLGSQSVIQKSYNTNLIKSLVIIGVFLGIGIYLLLVYTTTNKQQGYIYLGLFCLFNIVLESTLDLQMIYELFPNIPFNIYMRISYLAYMGVVVTIQFFMNDIYEQRKESLRSINGMNMIYAIIIIYTPVKFFNYSNIIYQIILGINMIRVIWVMIRVVVKKVPHSKLLFGGVVVMGATVVMQVIFLNTLINYGAYYNYMLGMLFFLTCQIYVLSLEVCDAFEQSSQAKDMEIAFLQAQIAPHFFFNTLNNIYCLMDESVVKARNLIIDFCDFLRVKHKFDYRKNVFYTLKEELDLIKAYVKIENVRLDNRLKLKIEVGREFLEIPIPQLLIQPLVENAIKHGGGHEGICITIEAIRQQDNVEIMVSDTGCGMRPEQIRKILNTESDETTGVGIKNINYRLDKCYHSQLKIKSCMGEGTCISFQIPCSGTEN